MTFAATVRSSVTISKRVANTTAKSLASTRQFSSDKKHATPTNFATKCASLYHPSEKANRGLAPPIYFGSTYTLDDADHGARLHDKKEAAFTDEDGFVYSRWGSPTNEACAKQIAALEGVDESGTGGTMLFGSGMSGITSALMSVLKTGDHAVFPYTVYGGTHEFLKEFAVHWGVEIDFIDGAGKDGPENYRAALRENTRVVYCETPANPTCRITDLSGVGKVVDEFYGTREENPNRPWVMCDGTFATPYHMRPLDFTGVDVSIQSCTKYLGGHSDILAGSVSSKSSEFCHGLAKVQKLITAPLNPMDSYLLMRGIRTLDVRMQRHGENALQVAQMLEAHPLIESTFYPGLESHPDNTGGDDCLVANAFRSGRDSPEDASIMKQTYGGMIAFIVKGEGDVALERAKKVCEGLRVVNLAVSLGSVESLVEHPASMTHAMIPREDRIAGGLDDGLIRISVGIERASDLVEDLKSSLDRVMEEEREKEQKVAVA
jgi:methionine-gamma-lyase